MSNPPPPILDYRPPRPKSDRAVWFDRSAVYFVFLIWPVLIGWFYVAGEIVRYCTSAAPFASSAVVVSLVTLAASIGLGLALRGRR